ncbi:MAG: hypothetical protein ABJJ37_20800, partial [Roseibium sp.]
MKIHSKLAIVAGIAGLALLTACGSRVKPAGLSNAAPPAQLDARNADSRDEGFKDKTFWSYFNQPDQENSVLVNR